MKKAFGLLILLLTACAGIPISSPSPIQLILTELTIVPSGTSHMLYSGGTIGKGDRYEAYCRLDVGGPLDTEKMLNIGAYLSQQAHHRLVNDDLFPQAVGFQRERMFDILNAENVFSLLEISFLDASSPLKRLRCFQEYQDYFEAIPLTPKAINHILPSGIRLSF